MECQLSALKECINLFEIRRALAELPETLDETYARILKKIPKKYHKTVHCALQMLAVSRRPLSVEEIAEAAIVDYESEQFDPILHRLRNPLYIVKICSGMVMIRLDEYDSFIMCIILRNERNKLRFAHFSVKEYLVSERISKSVSPPISGFPIPSPTNLWREFRLYICCHLAQQPQPQQKCTLSRNFFHFLAIRQNTGPTIFTLAPSTYKGH